MVELDGVVDDGSEKSSEDENVGCVIGYVEGPVAFYRVVCLVGVCFSANVEEFW